MREHTPPLDVLLVPTNDAHQSEYVSERDCRREFITGFTGSAGDAVVTQERALLFVDGRYHLQAEQQVDGQLWTVMKLGLAGVPTLDDWLAEQATAAGGSLRVGFDPTLMSQALHERLRGRLQSTDAQLCASAANLVDAVWAGDRPNPAPRAAMAHPLVFAGASVADKVRDLRAALDKRGAYAVVLSALDEIAWLLNVRGWDVHCNPVVVSFAVVTHHLVVWYVDSSRLDDAELAAHLAAAAVTTRPYASLFADLADPQSLLFADVVVAAAADKSLSVVAEQRWTSVAVAASVEQNRLTRLQSASLIALPKALKNAVELDGMRRAHLKDGVALVSFLAWLDDQLRRTDAVWTEYTASERLAEFRARQPDFVSTSFDTIFGCGAAGAIIHYKPEQATAATLRTDEVLLIDSGAQFRDGTTDVTRTVYFAAAPDARPPAFVRMCNTRVLQGHIALASAVFPKGTTGFQLDILARKALWSAGLDYLHGTGHGVGSFLNVHEGPHGISFRPTSNEVPLLPGMVVTNEPGYYQQGQFGIRIESVLVVKPADTPHRFADKEFYCFETITVAPIQASLVDFDLMSPDEIAWLDAYNQRVVDQLSPQLSEQERAWLQAHTAH